MGTFVPFLRDGAFEPKDVQAMSMALEDVCKALRLDGENPAREVMAARIIDLARGGVRSPTILRDRALHEAGLAEYVALGNAREARNG
jgi:hypothetical protein